jgi:hypothetical protein
LRTFIVGPHLIGVDNVLDAIEWPPTYKIVVPVLADGTGIKKIVPKVVRQSDAVFSFQTFKLLLT